MTVKEVVEKYARILMLPLSDGEDWRVIKDYPNYIVTSLGRVFNTKTGKQLKPLKSDTSGAKRNSYNYYRYWVRLCNQGKFKNFYVHTLVANAFLDKPDGIDLVVNHKNHDTSDNRVENLEWTTRTANSSDQLRNRWTSYSLYELIELRKKTVVHSKEYHQLNNIIAYRRKRNRKNIV